MSSLFPSSFVKWATVLASAILFSGCTSNQYFMVEKKDLNQLGDSVEAQGRYIANLEQKTVEQISGLAEKNETSTQAILSVLNEQAQRYSCPPAPAPAECKNASEPARKDSTGRTDRLKGKVIVGELEKFYLAVPGLVFDARIDSGAETSSLDARNITRFERDGNNWVRFDVPNPDTGELITLEKEISRRVRIIQSSTDESERRVVVELQFMIGNHHQQAEFTLTNREQMSHSVLVGRNILRDVMLIDVGKEYATELPSPLPNDSGSESP